MSTFDTNVNLLIQNIENPKEMLSAEKKCSFNKNKSTRIFYKINDLTSYEKLNTAITQNGEFFAKNKFDKSKIEENIIIDLEKIGKKELKVSSISIVNLINNINLEIKKNNKNPQNFNFYVNIDLQKRNDKDSLEFLMDIFDSVKKSNGKLYLYETVDGSGRDLRNSPK